VTDAQFAACDDYMRGFVSVIGAERTGIYAGLHYMNHCHAVGIAQWFWQAGATSWNHDEDAQMTVHLEQTTQAPPLPGTDHNYIYTANYGQVGGGPAAPEKDDNMPTYNDSQNAVMWPNGNGYYTSYEQGVYNALKFWIDNGKELPGTEGTVQREIYNVINAVTQRDVQAQVTAIVAAIRAALPAGQGGDVDEAAIIAGVLAGLPKSYTVTANPVTPAN
jgi:hypothetical protein